MSKKYKTAMGKSVDMSALRTQNEKVRAVGNMNVNARGDTIDSHNKIINDANKRVSERYKKITNKPVTAQTQKPKQNIQSEMTKEELKFDMDDEPNPEK